MSKTIAIIVGILLVVIVAGYFTIEKLSLALPSGAKKVGELSTLDSSYTCDEELCLGWCVINCDVPTTEPKVVFRTNVASSSDYDDSGKWFVINCAVSNNQCIETTDLISYCRDSSFTSTCGVTTKVKDILFGTSLYARSSYLYVSTEGHCRKYSLCSTGDTTKTPLEPYKSNNQEMYDSQTQYACTYNAEVSSDANWGYKNKIRTETYAWTDSTDKKDFTQNNVISCNPLDYKNVPLPTEKSTIYIEKYSLACVNECQQSQSYCKPKQYFCTQSEARAVCGNYNVGRDYNQGRAPECGAWSDIYYCRDNRKDNSYYLKCDGTKTVSNVVCNDWKTEVKCTSPQVCKPLNSAIGTEGIGSCLCQATDCDGKGLGYKKADTINNNQYYECITQNNCPTWSTTKSCSTGLIFSEALQDCVCDNKCSDYKKTCLSDTTLEECTPITISGKNCWTKVVKTAPGDTSKYPRICCDINNPNPICKDIEKGNAKFECISQPCTSINEKRCSGNTLQNCARDSESNCMYLDNIGAKTKCCINSNSCDAGYECTNNNCEKVAGYCNINSECGSGKICVNNKCEFPTTGEYCTQTQANAGDRICIDNNVHICKSQTDGSCKWELLDTCSEEEICVAQSNSVCKPVYEYVGVICPEGSACKWGLNDNIGNIEIHVTSNVGDNNNIKVNALLKDNAGATIKKVETLTNSEGKAFIDFSYSHPKSETLVIEVYVGNVCVTDIADPQCYKTTKNIEIMKKIDLKLNCPIQAYSNVDVICEFKAQDFETNTLLNPDSTQIKVEQGITSLSYNTISTTQFSFKTSVTGSVNVKVITGKSGYISDTEEVQVQIVVAQQDYVFEINNKNIFEYGTDGIDTGTKQLVIRVTEGGQPLDAQIDATMRSPTGKVVPLVFVSQGTGIYKTTYNFEEAGDTYVFKGTIIFAAVGKQSIPFEYKIATLESGAKKTTGIYWIIGGGIVAILIFIIILANILKK